MQEFATQLKIRVESDRQLAFSSKNNQREDYLPKLIVPQTVTVGCLSDQLLTTLRKNSSVLASTKPLGYSRFRWQKKPVTGATLCCCIRYPGWIFGSSCYYFSSRSDYYTDILGNFNLFLEFTKTNNSTTKLNNLMIAIIV